MHDGLCQFGDAAYPLNLLIFELIFHCKRLRSTYTNELVIQSNLSLTMKIKQEHERLALNAANLMAI